MTNTARGGYNANVVSNETIHCRKGEADGVELSAADRKTAEGCFLFRGAPDALDAALSDAGCSLAEYARGEVVYSREKFRRAVGVILSGRVGVKKGGGGRDKAVNVLSQGRSFGVAALFGEGGYVSLIVAEAPSRILFFDEALLGRLIARRPEIALNLVRFLSDRIRFLNARIDSLLVTGAQRAVAGRILEETEGACGVYRPAGSLGGLAQSLNISRASLYRAFEALEQAGAIRKTGADISVLDRDKLNRIYNAYCDGGMEHEKDL